MIYLFDATGIEVKIGDWIYYRDGGKHSVGILIGVDNSERDYLIIKDIYSKERASCTLSDVRKISESKAAIIMLEKE